MKNYLTHLNEDSCKKIRLIVDVVEASLHISKSLETNNECYSLRY